MIPYLGWCCIGCQVLVMPQYKKILRKISHCVVMLMLIFKKENSELDQ